MSLVEEVTNSYIPVLLSLVITVVVGFWKWNSTRANLPPRVYGLPLVGYLPFIETKNFLTLDTLGKKLGGVYRLKLGSQEVLVLTDFEAIQEAYQKQTFLGRPELSALQGKHVNGFVVMSGDGWKEQRKFTVKSLHKMGYGNVKMEDHMKDELNEIVNVLRDRSGRPTTIQPILQSSVGNGISKFIYGHGLPPTDPKRLDIEKAVKFLNLNVRQIQRSMFLPWLAKLMPDSTIKNLQLNRKKLYEIFINDIRSHESTLDLQNPQGYIDEYLVEMENNKSASFTRERLRGNIQLMYVAGVQTVVTTLEWCFVAMAAYPDVQSRVHEEIDRTIGQDGRPSWGDRNKLPYVGAVLMEVQRWRTVFPFLLFRRTTEATTVRGYDVPKDTVVIPNSWSVHNDPKIWPEPSKFYPERFLSEDRKDVVKKDAFMAFSYGKRACPGELLAQMELYFYFVYVMKDFTVSAPEVDEDGQLAVSFYPKMRDFVFTIRK